MEVKAPVTRVNLGAGCAITVVGDYVGQAIYWSLVSYDPLGVLPDGAPRGMLKWSRTFTDASLRTVNFYYAPDASGAFGVKYGSGVKFGTRKFGDNDSGLLAMSDKLIVRYGD